MDDSKKSAFIEANEGTCDIDLLETYAQVLENVSTMGCVYNESLMERIASMSASMIPLIKTYLLRTDRNASSVSMLNTALHSLSMSWRISNGSDTVFSMNGLVVCRYSFRVVEEDSARREAITNAVVETFLNSESAIVEEDEVHFDGIRPVQLYEESVKRNILKAKKHLPDTANNRKALEKAFDMVNLPFFLSAEQIKGWEQRVELRSGDVILIAEVLGKSECTRVKMDARVDAMAARVIAAIHAERVQFTRDEDNRLILQL